MNLKIKLSNLFAAIFLCALATLPLRAQTSASVKMGTVQVSAATNDPVASSNLDEKNSAEAGTQSARTDNAAAILASQNQVEISKDLHETVAQVIAIIAGCSIPIAVVAILGLYLFFRHRKNIMLHDTLRAMIDKGVPIPPELLHRPESDRARRPRNDFRTALILVGVGAGLELADRGTAGMIVLFMGFAFLLAALFDRRKSNRETDLPEPEVGRGEKTNDQPPKI